VIALFFEVKPKPDQVQRYLDTAAALKPKLDASGGCLFIDRFKSRQRGGWLLSYQIWQDEASMVRWRVNGSHHHAQTAGRTVVFDDYRLRVAQIVRDEVPGKPAWQPQRLNIYNDPVRTPPRYCTLIESQSAQFDGTPLEFESLYRVGQFAHLADANSLAQALDMSEQCRVSDSVRFRIAEIERDYGMFDRAQAPTYYPAVARPQAKPPVDPN
jgi:heme-degrading monooxygenase HmoA